MIVVAAAQRVISQYLEFLICHGSVATRETNCTRDKDSSTLTSQIHLMETLKATATEDGLLLVSCKHSIYMINLKNYLSARE